MSDDGDLYRLWCSFPECLRYAKFELGIDGAHVCRKHARDIRARQRVEHLLRITRPDAARTDK